MFHTGHSSSVDHRRSSVQANSAGIRVKKAPWSADLGTRWMGGLPAGCGMSRMPMTQAHSLAFLSPRFSPYARAQPPYADACAHEALLDMFTMRLLTVQTSSKTVQPHHASAIAAA